MRAEETTFFGSEPVELYGDIGGRDEALLNERAQDLQNGDRAGTVVISAWRAVEGKEIVQGILLGVDQHYIQVTL